MTSEFELLSRTFGWGAPEFSRILAATWRAAFAGHQP
jgi:hypothetical protein